MRLASAVVLLLLVAAGCGVGGPGAESEPGTTRPAPSASETGAVDLSNLCAAVRDVVSARWKLRAADPLVEENGARCSLQSGVGTGNLQVEVMVNEADVLQARIHTLCGEWHEPVRTDRCGVKAHGAGETARYASYLKGHEMLVRMSATSPDRTLLRLVGAEFAGVEQAILDLSPA